jgi:WD40 repeat protein
MGWKVQFYDFFTSNLIITLEFVFSRGIASFDHGFLCSGNSQGFISVFRVPTRDGNNIEFGDSIETKAIAISALSASSRLLVAGNDNGDIYGFDPHNAFDRVCRCVGLGYPCTSIATREDSIIASFSSGHIRTYRASLSEIAIELTAHGRAIYALALHPSLDIIASCGEDQYMNVWSVPDFSSQASSEMDLLASCCLPNKKLTGIAFASSTLSFFTQYLKYVTP